MISGNPQPYRSTRPMMGTFVTVIVDEPDPMRAEEMTERAFAVMWDWCAQASEWEPDSALSRLSNAQAGEQVPLPDLLFRLLELAARVWRDSGGAFDPSWLPLKSLWPLRDQRLPPDADRVAEALSLLGFDDLRLLDGTPPCAIKRRSSLRIGLGAIAKGAAVDLACEALEAAGASRYLVDAGGDIRGRHLDGGWQIGRRDGTGKRLQETLDLRHAAIATSGSYELGFLHAGRRYHHLLDPRTGQPTLWQGGVSVIAPSCALADALATACFILGPDAGRSLLRNYRGVAACWADEQDRIDCSEDWPKQGAPVRLPPASGFC